MAVWNPYTGLGRPPSPSLPIKTVNQTKCPIGQAWNSLQGICEAYFEALTLDLGSMLIQHQLDQLSDQVLPDSWEPK